MWPEAVAHSMLWVNTRNRLEYAHYDTQLAWEAWQASAELCAKAPEMAAALDCIVRRLQLDVDDGSRPDQWTMEDLIRTAKASLPASLAK